MDSRNSRRSKGLSKSCILIIVVASVERFAYKGVASNLVTYLTEELKMSTSAAAKNVNSWSGVTSMLPLIGAFLTDSYWNRYSTILCSSLIYVLGLMALTSWAILCTAMSAWIPTSSLFLPLYLISVAQGGYNPSLQAFGADQLNLDEDEDGLPTGAGSGGSNRKSVYFQWWYIGVCCGSLMGNSLMSYIQDTYGWHIGFAIPAAAMGAAAALFVLGSRLYVHKQNAYRPDGDQKSVKDLLAEIKVALKNNFRLRNGKNGTIKVATAEDPKIAELELQEQSSLLDEFNSFKLSFIATEATTTVKPSPPSSLLDEFDSSKLSFIATEATTTVKPSPPNIPKVVLRLLPIWAVLLMFAVIFQQPLTFFTKQGMVMRRHVRGFAIPPAALQSSITISIILLMPLYEKLFVPLARTFTGNSEGVTVCQRIGVGMFLSIVAMAVAATVEARRLKEGDLSIFWLLPQYILLGVSDVFTVVGMQEFFYSQVPSAMRTLGIALYISVFGMGSFLGAFLISAIEVVTHATGGGRSWFSDDMSEAQLHKYYWFLTALSVVSFAMFVYLRRYYEEEVDDSNHLADEEKV